jgi:hypothetical protein
MKSEFCILDESLNHKLPTFRGILIPNKELVRFINQIKLAVKKVVNGISRRDFKVIFWANGEMNTVFFPFK